MASQYVSDNSGTYIPATQRPDGSWRKARRVKEGYVPQEEVPLYESKGKQWAKSQSAYPPGMNPIVSPQSDGRNQSGMQIIPGLTTIVSDVSKSSKKKKKKKSKTEFTDDPANKVSVEFQKLEISPLPKSDDKPTIDNSTTDPVKRLKNLKKKLREIENLESRISSGELAKPEKEQLDKIARKDEIEMLIDDLEMEIENS